MVDTIAYEDGNFTFAEEMSGGLPTAELTINRDEFDSYELQFDVAGTVPLNEFINKIDSKSFEFDMSSFQTSIVEVREADSGTENDDVEDLTESLSQTQRSQMPPIPDDNGLETESNYTHYHRLVNNPDSQPAKYRRLIRSEGKIKRPRFDRWTERQDLNPKGGSHNASLLMLERIDEIERRGTGDDQVIVWVGE